MSQTADNNKRIAKNTLLLYIRMFLLILVQLYTVPIILRELGVEDYGIYNVVGGVVTLFSFVGGSLASGSQRFIAFEIGRGNPQALKNVFDTTVSIYIILAIISAFLLEIGGYWFLNAKMNIPIDRMVAANWVFQFSIFSFLAGLISIPYNATVIAHERMSLYAYVSMFECVLKLFLAISLKYVLSDKLIVYSSSICLISWAVCVIYQIYCRRHFPECRHYRFKRNPYMGKDLLAYSGWNMVGSVALISRQQGLNIVLNLFFGPLLNAAHSIAQQINGVLSQFINNVYMATRPQVTKLYASGNEGDMWNLVFRSAKLAFYLFMLISVPAIIEMEGILDLWLHEVPPYTVQIVRLMILSAVIETLSNQVIGAYQAANRIRRYQMYSSTVILLNIPVSYALLKMHVGSPLLPYVVSVILSVLYVLSILYNARKDIGLDLKAYTRRVLLPDILVYVLVIGIIYGIVSLSPFSIVRIFMTVGLTLLCSAVIVWAIGLDIREKDFIGNMIKNKIGNKISK